MNEWAVRVPNLGLFLYNFSLLAVGFKAGTLNKTVLQGSAPVPTPHSYLVFLPSAHPCLAPSLCQRPAQAHLASTPPTNLHCSAAALAIFSEGQVECHHLRQADQR